LVFGFTGAWAALAAMVVFSFLPPLATVAHDLGGAATGRVKGLASGAEGREGAVAGNVKSIGVGVSGRGVASLNVLTPSVSASICSLSASMAVL